MRLERSEKRNAYHFWLRRLMDEYRSQGTVDGERPRDAQHALRLARAAAQKKARRD